MNPDLLPDRFWVKVDRDGPVSERRPDLGPCWLWTAGVNGDGYPLFRFEGHDQLAHRVIYRLLVAAIPPGFEVDHLCFVTVCVNPDHLEAVTPRENKLRSSGPSGVNARKTHCKHGHAFDQKNTRYSSARERVCRACVNRRKANERARRVAP